MNEALFDNSADVSKAAFAALSSVTEPEDIMSLYSLLESCGEADCEAVQKAILTALEGKSNAEKFELLSNRLSIVTPAAA